MSTFIQIHTLTSHPASLLNRGEEGFAKTVPFGGSTRTRISSQCLKYNWRTYDGQDSIRDIDETEMSVRSRQTFYRLIAEPLIDEDYEPEVVYPAVRRLQLSITDSTEDFEVENSIEAGREDDEDHLQLGQVVVFGPQEVKFMRSVVREQLDEIDSNAEDLAGEIESVLPGSYDAAEISEGVDAVAPAGLDAAMFGRMALDAGNETEVEGAIHVKHALTVHPHQRESDYFIAADDFQESGGGHLNSKSLTSGLYYTNVVVDHDSLAENLSGREDIADELVRRLIKIIATVTPGAKKSSTAPYSHAEFLMVERGERQPRTLANAFRNGLSPEEGVEEAQRRLDDYLSGMDGMYDQSEDRYVSGVSLPDPVPESFGQKMSLSEIQAQI